MSNPYEGDSNSQNTPGLTGTNSAGGIGVLGDSGQFEGVRGFSHNPSHAGVVGISDKSGGNGVYGTCDDGQGGAPGKGVWGLDTSNSGGIGVAGESKHGEGVRGVSHNPNHAGVVGINDGNGDAVYGTSTAGRGVVGHSDSFDGVWGETHNPNAAAVSGRNLNADGTINNAGLAGFFGGNVNVTGDITLTGGDCAENFNIAGAQQIEPGTVMVIDDTGALQQSEQAYDKRVAGVISGAGGYKAGIILDKQQSEVGRAPVALVGKVYCKVDASYEPVEVGDLLTTSPTTGHAM